MNTLRPNLRIRILCIAVLFTSAWTAAQAQNFACSGIITDGVEPLVGVNVLLISQRDSTRRQGSITDLDGKFELANVRGGAYQLRATYVGYKTLEMEVVIRGADQNLGALRMEQAALQLQGVTVEATQIRAQQKGDTTEYNAAAFKVNPDADAEQLVRKMPGVTVEGGTVRAQGEDVRRVTVDGQEFFGEDAVLALRNLPAEVIDRIQVFDRMSDQAQFTGFNDGNTEKTINIVTRGGLRNAQFGRVYGGYGTDERYSAGANLNFFKGSSRISFIGLANNINQQNFSTQDLLGVVGNSSQRGGPGGAGGGRGSGGGPGGRGNWGGNNDINNFLVGQQGGINTTNSVGLNYTDNWGRKVKINSSYFFNNSGNDSRSILQREFFLSENISQFYDENNVSESNNFNHRFNARIEYTIDSTNSIIITPRLSFQNNRTSSLLLGANRFDANALINSTDNDLNAQNNGFNFGNNILYRHRMAKAGRTFSVNLNTDFNDRSGRSDLYSQSLFFNTQDSSLLNDQRTNLASDGYTLSAGLTYTEPLGKKSILQFEYRPTLAKNASERETNQFEEITGAYTRLDSVLSNSFDNETVTQRGGLSYRWRDEKVNFAIGANYQTVLLSSAQNFPLNLAVEKNFYNLLPNAMLILTPSRNQSLRIFYRTFTMTPNINQLQNVVNNSNPLQLSTGNPNLRQQLTHSVFMRYNLTEPNKARTLFAFFNTSFTDDFIATSTLIASRDTTLQEGVTLFRGAQLSQPVNLSGNWNARSFLTYGMPMKALKSNLNINAGLSYARTPGLINNVQNESQTYNVNGGLVLGSNISEKIDFTVSYSANYNIVENTLQPQLNNNFFFHNASLRFNWLPWKGLVLNTDVTNTLYTGLGNDFNQNFVLWNAAIGYKFLKGNAGELRLNAFDLLGQNNSIARVVTETYVEDNITQVLTRYFMLSFVYNLRNFSTGNNRQNK
ncbi:MAG TPA: TonB-dependent receptor [Saprospiraceae bacterium]|nr:TonB-dependent receptor [Saprospiraceae bacterium]